MFEDSVGPGLLFQPGALSSKISGSREEDLTHEQGNVSITFEGQRSSGINLYTPLWNTSLLWSTSCLQRSERGGAMPSGGVSCDSELTLFPSCPQVLFHSIFGPSCSTVSWLIVILINGWQWLDSCPNTGSIASPSPCLQPALLPSLSGTGGGLSMKLSSHSCVYTLQPLPDPVNVLSVSWHTRALNNDPVVKSCTNKEPCPLPSNNLQRVSAPKWQKKGK